jgi:hypothetical protein
MPSLNLWSRAIRAPGRGGGAPRNTTIRGSPKLRGCGLRQYPAVLQPASLAVHVQGQQELLHTAWPVVQTLASPLGRWAGRHIGSAEQASCVSTAGAICGALGEALC